MENTQLPYHAKALITGAQKLNDRGQWQNHLVTGGALADMIRFVLRPGPEYDTADASVHFRGTCALNRDECLLIEDHPDFPNSGDKR